MAASGGYVRILPMTNPIVVLASSSPRRKELLSWMGMDFSTTSADIDETPLPGENPVDYALRLAQEKAHACIRYAPFGAVVLAADTTVADGDEIIGKPLDVDDARRMLQRLRGRTHLVHTAFVTSVPSKGNSVFELCSTQVKMRRFTDKEIEDYLATGDPLDKAGAYAIQHQGFNPVEKISGCFANVMGLPLCHFERVLRRMGFDVRRFVPYRCQRELSYTCPIFKRVLAGENIG